MTTSDRKTRDVILPVYTPCTVETNVSDSQLASAYALEQPEEVEGEHVDRPVGDLLKLDTYQGMSDNEIQSIIDYRVDQAHKDVLSNSYRAQAQGNIESANDAMDAMRQNSADMLDRVLASMSAYSTSSDQSATLETFEPRGV